MSGITSARKRWIAAVGGVALVLAGAGCSDNGAGRDDDGEPPAVPAAEASVFGEGDFDEIPIFRGATPVQGPARDNGTVTASYEAVSDGPETVIRYYEENLPALGWTVADPVRETGEDVWRGDWLREGRRLQVSATLLPRERGEDLTTQFSLVLLDDAGDIPVATTPSGVTSTPP